MQARLVMWPVHRRASYIKRPPTEGPGRGGLSLQSIATRLTALTLGLTLAATQLKADANSQMPQSVQRMDRVWMLTYVNADGVETIAQTRCACRKSNSHIQMMKSAKKWRRQNATNGMYGSRRGRVFVE
jgi:hypothetical protein